MDNRWLRIYKNNQRRVRQRKKFDMAKVAEMAKKWHDRIDRIDRLGGETVKKVKTVKTKNWYNKNLHSAVKEFRMGVNFFRKVSTKLGWESNNLGK